MKLSVPWLIVFALLLIALYLASDWQLDVGAPD
jgi:hypothetical protein